MYEIKKLFDNILEMNDFFASPFDRFELPKISTNGLKSSIHRPHNLKEIKDKDGNVTAQKIEVVTTPFDKEDVKVTIKDNLLSVSCGSENKKTEENEDFVYQGISSQTYSFTLTIPDTIEKNKIKASNKDGILSIVMPVKKPVEKEPEEIEIKID